MWENHRKRDNLFFSYASNIRKHVTLPQSPSPSSSTNIAFIKMYYSARGPLAWDAQCNSPQASERVFTYITALTLTHILIFFLSAVYTHPWIYKNYAHHAAWIQSNVQYILGWSTRSLRAWTQNGGASTPSGGAIPQQAPGHQLCWTESALHGNLPDSMGLHSTCVYLLPTTST